MNKSVAFLLKTIVYTLLIALIAVLQVTLVPRLKVFGVVPDLFVGAIASVGVYRGKKTGAVFGLIAGLTAEALGSYGVSLIPVLYTFIGLLCGVVGDNARAESFFAAYLITLPTACAFRSLITILHFFIRYNFEVNFKALLLNTILPEYIYTLLICIPVLIVVKLFELPINNIEREDG